MGGCDSHVSGGAAKIVEELDFSSGNWWRMSRLLMSPRMDHKVTLVPETWLNK